MKFKSIICLMGLGLLLSACSQDAPEIPEEELFLRNFIKMFGLIDPEQDWNLAEQSEVTINLPNRAKEVTVYAEVFDDFYRVARCYDLPEGVVKIPIDVPVNTTRVAVDIDGSRTVMPMQASLKVTPLAETGEGGAADSDEMPLNIFLDEENILGWVVVAEDLGSTDDVDFNDVVARLSYSENSYYALGTVTPDQWDKIDQGQQGDLYFDGSEVGFSRADASLLGKTVVTIKPLAAGGVLKVWLHYRDTSGSTETDYIIGPGNSANCIVNGGREISNPDAYEWHRWFGETDGVMINTADPNQSNSENQDYNEVASFILRPIKGTTIDFEVPGAFSFTTYSQAKYESFNPLEMYNFDFDRQSISGFYITVRSHAFNSDNPAYDMGKVIGHNRHQGLPPQMFLIPDLCYTKSNAADAEYGDAGAKQQHFRWPTERTLIDVAYPKFPTWVSKGSVTWYQFGRQDYVVGDAFINAIYRD